MDAEIEDLDNYNRTLVVPTTNITSTRPDNDERRTGQLHERITPRREHSVSADMVTTRARS